ncbi:hypothetical protein DFH09DRAFT_1309740 [Mycena vulgaris]|nr:hypothetical protein DFH09DRAFT_1309740 [Mycena vulgaris]
MSIPHVLQAAPFDSGSSHKPRDEKEERRHLTLRDVHTQRAAVHPRAPSLGVSRSHVAPAPTEFCTACRCAASASLACTIHVPTRQRASAAPTRRPPHAHPPQCCIHPRTQYTSSRLLRDVRLSISPSRAHSTMREEGQGPARAFHPRIHIRGPALRATRARSAMPGAQLPAPPLHSSIHTAHRPPNHDLLRAHSPPRTQESGLAPRSRPRPLISAPSTHALASTTPSRPPAASPSHSILHEFAYNAFPFSRPLESLHIRTSSPALRDQHRRSTPRAWTQSPQSSHGHQRRALHNVRLPGAGAFPAPARHVPASRRVRARAP